MMYEQVDLTKLIQLNDGSNGIFFLGDPDTGKIYGSEKTLSILINPDLGIAPLLPVLLPVIGTVASGVLSLFGGNSKAKQQQELMQQQARMEAARQAASMQMLLIGGGLLVGGVVLYSVLN